jgi:transcriptional regulator with XRE-family HTH domain
VNYGKALKIARAMTGMQQKELAALVEMDASHISLIEKGKRKPSAQALGRLCQALKIPSHLFMLLGAEKNDLRIAAPDEVQRAAESLAHLLFAHAPEYSSRRSRKTSRGRS